MSSKQLIGEGGGNVLVTGTPEKIAATPTSYTGQYLGPIMVRDRQRAKEIN